MSLRLFVSAGEPSGDRHLAHVLAHLNAETDLEIKGLAGPDSRAEGVEGLADFSRLSVLGFAEVFTSIPYFLSLYRRCVKTLRDWSPDALLLVDYPGFNQRLGCAAKKLGIPVLYYIAPQTWAWKKDRRPGIARSADHVLSVFPFEVEHFEAAGIQTTFVGHPLLEDLGPSGNLPVKRREKVLVLLPGSRRQEVEILLPLLVSALRPLKKDGVQGIVSRRKDLDPGLYQCALEEDVECWDGPIRDLVTGADAAVVASGTATLEVGLTGTPMMVVYRTGWLNWQLARRLVRIQSVALANIAAGGSRIPELLQQDCNPIKISRLARKLLYDPVEREEQATFLGGLRGRLGSPGASRRVAKIVLEAMRTRS